VTVTDKNTSGPLSTQSDIVQVQVQQPAGTPPPPTPPPTTGSGNTGGGGSGNTDISHAYGYPVPWTPKSTKSGIVFTGLAAGSEIKISSTDGVPVVTLHSSDGNDLLWLLKNDSGDNVASGVYLFVVKAGGQKKTGKLVIVR
jgi:hypothetical protein